MSKGVSKCGVLVCVCLVLCAVCPVPAFADEWVLDEVYLEDVPAGDNPAGYQEADALTVWDVLGDDFIPDEDDLDWIASASDALRSSPSDASPMASYDDVYDGTISGTYLTYARDTVSKFSPGSHYVFFRPSQYEYRLVYGADMSVDGSYFTGSALRYVSYNSRYNTFRTGSEGAFSLETNARLVYTDLEGMYPSLDSGVRNVEFKALLFVAVMYLLYSIVRSFFSVGSYRA